MTRKKAIRGNTRQRTLQIVDFRMEIDKNKAIEGNLTLKIGDSRF